MTYIVGIQQLGINTIICDTRVTWWRSNAKVGGENTSLKSGVLFPGCLYAITGDLEQAGSFIKEYKQRIEGTYNTLEGLWSDFAQFAEKYSSKGRNRFLLLLSSRTKGKPEFFIFDSRSRNLAAVEKLITLGSGKELLDQRVSKWFSSREKAINDTIVSNKLPPFTFPYFYCLWLNEITQGEELSKLEQYDVGGIFHFLWQNSDGEYVQHPAVYVLAAADNNVKTICIWVYRVAYVDDCLVIDNPVIEAREFFFSSVSRPSRAIDHYSNNWANVMEEIGAKADTLPFYYFCGFGFPQLIHRGPFGCHVTTKDDYVITKSGGLAPDYKALIVKHFRRDYALKLEK